MNQLSNDQICALIRSPRPGGRPAHALTPRDKQIACLLKTGALNKQIAWNLSLSEGTVKQYIFRICAKLGMTNRTQVAVWAALHPEEVA